MAAPKKQKDPVKLVRVKATAKGYDGTRVREPGEEFDMPEGAKGTWFDPVDAQPEKKAEDNPAA